MWVVGCAEIGVWCVCGVCGDVLVLLCCVVLCCVVVLCAVSAVC